MRIKQSVLFGVLLIGMIISWCSVALGQEMGGEIEMADVMRSSGKIYVVVAVLVIVFAGMVVYLIQIDRKLQKLEKELTDKK